MRVYRICHVVAAAAFLFIVLGGCSAQRASFVAVRERAFRSEDVPSDRITLPLDDSGQNRLREYLRAGGNNDRIEEEVDPEADAHYAPLLDLLADAKNLSRDDLLEHRTFGQWFERDRTREIVDARNERPEVIQPIAVKDERYYWVFYHRAGYLTSLLVMLRSDRKVPR